MGEIIPRPAPPIPMPFTGERLTSAYGGQTEIEHLHRYLLAREWCRDKDVLDVASGEGYGTALLAQVARSAIGVEIAPDAVAHAASSYARENLTYLQGDARALPVPDASRDVVISFETIEHFAEHQRFLSEVRRVLRPGGLFVASTPDRDNYSPTGSPVNTFHVKEMTAAEFEGLLRSSFAAVSFVMQRPMIGSVLLPTDAGGKAPLCFERRGPSHFEASVGLARAQYIIAFASDGPAAILPSSVYIESGQLGMLSPDGSAGNPGAVDQDGHIRPGQETEALQQRVATLTADLEACQLELAAARGEAKGLLAANEMAERACATLRSELFPGRPTEIHTPTVASQPQANVTSYERMRQLEADLADMRMSHSWRVTAPLRRISHLLRRRP
jgi:SAM-dependent methyltransferase